MDKALQHLHDEYAKLQTGRASTALVDGIMVESYGSMMPIKGLASIAVPESNQITIQPWSRDQLGAVEKAISNANLGLNPQNTGVLIRIILPPLTEDRRKELVKMVKKEAEEARISVRNARHDALNHFKNQEKDKLISEDELTGKEKEVQKMVDDINQKIDQTAENKEKEVMTV